MIRLLTAIFLLATGLVATGQEMRLELTPGTYASHADAVADAAPETLMLVGKADVRDLRAIAATLPASVAMLDMQGLEIEEYTYPFNSTEDRGYYPPSTIPASTFAHITLRDILFPLSLKAIGEGAFAGSALTAAHFPVSLNSLGDYAFAGCENIESILFCSPLEYLGVGAFRNCVSLRRADLYPTEIEYIPDALFVGCKSLKEILIPSCAKKMGSEVFAGSGLEDIILPYATDCAPFALAGMKELHTADVNYPMNADGMLFDTPQLVAVDKTNPDAPDLFLAASGITDSGISAGFKTIGDYSFAGSGARKLVLSSGVSRIGRGAFALMPGLASIDVMSLGSDVIDIDETAIEGINPSEIVLWVDSLAADSWRAHGVWNRFKIDTSGKSEVEAISVAESTIKIKPLEGKIVVSSPDVIKSIAIYSADGSLLFAWSPNKAFATVDTTPWHGTVVVADVLDAAGRRRQSKLVLR